MNEVKFYKDVINMFANADCEDDLLDTFDFIMDNIAGLNLEIGTVHDLFKIKDRLSYSMIGKNQKR